MYVRLNGTPGLGYYRPYRGMGDAGTLGTGYNPYVSPSQGVRLNPAPPDKVYYAMPSNANGSGGMANVQNPNQTIVSNGVTLWVPGKGVPYYKDYQGNSVWYNPTDPMSFPGPNPPGFPAPVGLLAPQDLGLIDDTGATMTNFGNGVPWNVAMGNQQQYQTNVLDVGFDCVPQAFLAHAGNWDTATINRYCNQHLVPGLDWSMPYGAIQSLLQAQGYPLSNASVRAQSAPPPVPITKSITTPINMLAIPADSGWVAAVSTPTQGPLMPPVPASGGWASNAVQVGLNPNYSPGPAYTPAASPASGGGTQPAYVPPANVQNNVMQPAPQAQYQALPLITPPPPGGASSAGALPAAVSAGSSLSSLVPSGVLDSAMSWISANPMLAAGGVLALLFMFGGMGGRR